MSDVRRVTVPAICSEVGVGRAVVERVLRQYAERLPQPQRAGVVRSWGPEIIYHIERILAEERRISEGRR